MKFVVHQKLYTHSRYHIILKLTFSSPLLQSIYYVARWTCSQCYFQFLCRWFCRIEAHCRWMPKKQLSQKDWVPWKVYPPMNQISKSVKRSSVCLPYSYVVNIISCHHGCHFVNITVWYIKVHDTAQSMTNNICIKLNIIYIHIYTYIYCTITKNYPRYAKL